MMTAVSNGSMLRQILVQVRYAMTVSKPLSLNSRSNFLLETIPS